MRRHDFTRSTAWSAILSGVGPDPQLALWLTLPSADQAQLLRTAPQLHPDVVTDVLTFREVALLAALAARHDLDPTTLADLAEDPVLLVAETLEANPAALTMLRDDAFTSAGRLNVARAEQLAARRPVPPAILERLLRDPRTRVRLALATNPTLRSADLGAVVDTEAHEDVARAVLGNPAADDMLRAQILAGRGFPHTAAEQRTRLIAQLLDASPHRWIPVLLRMDSPTAAARVVPYLSLLSAAGQARLVWQLTRSDATADAHLRNLYAADLTAEVTALIGGWIGAPGHPQLSVAEFDAALTDLLATLEGSPDVVDVVADEADTGTLVAEVRGSAWGRKPLHLQAARRLPWEPLLAALADLPNVSSDVLETLATHPHAPAGVGHMLLERAPGLLIDAALTRREHVVAALGHRDPLHKSRVDLLTWGLATFDIDTDTLASTVAPVSCLTRLLELTSTTAAGAAWVSRAVSELAARTAAFVGNDPTRLRLLETVGGASYPGTFTDLLAVASGVAADAGHGAARGPAATAETLT